MALSMCEEVQSYEFDEGVDFKDFAGRHNDATAISTGIAIFRSSAGLPLHIHGCDVDRIVIEENEEDPVTLCKSSKHPALLEEHDMLAARQARVN
jgi:hypothetical protein